MKETMRALAASHPRVAGRSRAYQPDRMDREPAAENTLESIKRAQTGCIG